MLRYSAALIAAVLFFSCGKTPDAGGGAGGNSGAGEAGGGTAAEAALIPSVTTVLHEDPIDFEWSDGKGTPVRFSAVRGKLTVVNFWATWCLPCKEETPDLVALSREYDGKGVVFVGLSTDRFDAESLVDEFVRKYSIPYTIVISDEDLEQAFGNVNFMPTTFLIGPDGKVLQTLIGLQSRAQFKKAIDQALGS